MLKKVLLNSVLVLLSMSWIHPAHAEQSKKIDGYTIYYSALPTTFLTAKVASDYNIKRSRNRAMINIAIRKEGKPVIAAVSATAVNLSKQLKKVFMRPIHDGQVVYYIGEVPVANRETLNFTVNITPENTNKNLKISFQEKFFTR